MSAGRKPDAKALRRSKDRAELTPRGTTRGAGALQKPVTVASIPNLSETWDLLTGSGMAYSAEDAPLIEQLVFDMETAAQCRRQCMDENGRIKMMVGVGEPDLDTGEYLESKPNPYLKIMREAVNEALKLADQLGLTPLARARLGLTQAAGKAVTLSVAEMIDDAIARRS